MAIIFKYKAWCATKVLQCSRCLVLIRMYFFHCRWSKNVTSQTSILKTKKVLYGSAEHIPVTDTKCVGIETFYASDETSSTLLFRKKFCVSSILLRLFQRIGESTEKHIEPFGKVSTCSINFLFITWIYITDIEAYTEEICSKIFLAYYYWISTLLYQLQNNLK